MTRYKITETWSSFVTIEADSLEDALKEGAKLIHSGKMDDVNYHGSDDDGVKNLDTEDSFDMELNPTN